MNALFRIVIAFTGFAVCCGDVLSGEETNKANGNAMIDGKTRMFWAWFVQNKNEFNGTEDQRKEFVSTGVDKLQTIGQDLTMEIELKKDGTRQVAISANGVEAEFPMVQSLVSGAPSIENWKVVAFKQPGQVKGVVLEFPGITLDVSKMWIFPIEDKAGFDLIVYFPDYTDANRNLFINATYVLLDNAIGEYNVVKGIRSLDFQKLPPTESRDGIRPFVDLPDVFARYQATHKSK